MIAFNLCSVAAIASYVIGTCWVPVSEGRPHALYGEKRPARKQSRFYIGAYARAMNAHGRYSTTHVVIDRVLK